MTYSGDPSLAPEIQNRVLSTFDQTAKLAAAGRRQEAVLGCEFILRLDPLFTPAKRLRERLDATDGPIPDAAELLRPSIEPPTESHKTVRLSAEDLRRLMADSDVGDEADAAVPASAARKNPEGDLVVDHGALAELLPVSAGQSAGKGGDEVTSFLAGIRRALDSGQIEAARRLIDMAGALDPQSPVLRELRDELASMTADPVDAGAERIAQLLAEGQRAFDDERYQDSIDCWSRIFLIEIDHDEANKRIQLARDLRDEQERQVEETFHHGMAAVDEGRRDAAVTAFRRVLEMRPNHLAAREHLDRLTGGEREAAGKTAAQLPKAAAEATGAAAPDDAMTSALPSDGPPRHADPAYRMAARAKRKPVNPFFLVGAVVMVLVAGGAWFLMENWSRFFPNAKEEVAPPPTRELVLITAKHDAGDLEGAIAAAEQIGTDSSEYMQARRLLARWKEELAARGAPAEPLTGDDAAKHVALVSRARLAYDDRNYLEAARNFTRASAMAPLATAEAELFDDAKRQLEPIAQQIDLYVQRQWDMALPALWRRLEQVPHDKDVQQLLVNSYFNLAIRELRRSQLPTALEYVEEASRLDRDDAGVARLKAFVTTYSALPRDLLFETYVQLLDFRH